MSSSRNRRFWRCLRKWASKRRAKRADLRFYSNVEVRIDGVLYEGVDVSTWERNR